MVAQDMGIARAQEPALVDALSDGVFQPRKRAAYFQQGAASEIELQSPIYRIFFCAVGKNEFVHDACTLLL